MWSAFMPKILKQFRSLLSSPELPGGLIVALGILLRLRQYFADRSLWVDEASLALNIVNRSFGGLTRPLDYNQGSPVGFLFIEKFFVLIFGNNEYSLRLFPLASGLLSIYLIWRIVREQIGIYGRFAVLMIAISPPLIYYSSELKQYSSDVMFSLLIVYLATFCLRGSPKIGNYISLGIAGMVSIWVSHPSVFVLAGTGLILVFKCLNEKTYKQLVPILGMGALWALMLGMTYFISLRYLMANTYLKDYWINNFVPIPPWSNLDWYPKAFSSLLGNIASSFEQSYWSWLCFFLVLFGFVSYFSKNRNIALLLFAPFPLTLLASALQRYPFGGRLIFFLVPFIVLFMSNGLSLIYELFVRWNHRSGLLVYGIIALLLLGIPGYEATQNFISPPMEEHIKPVLEYIQANDQAGDTIYVYSGSVTPFRYYAPFYGLDLDTTTVIEGSGGVNRFLRDLNELDGRNRIWFIFTHVIGCGYCTGDKLQFYVQSLDEHGTQMDDFHAPGADVFLYDLTQ